jgi:hypothetical protein
MPTMNNAGMQPPQGAGLDVTPANTTWIFPGEATPNHGAIHGTAPNPIGIGGLTATDLVGIVNSVNWKTTKLSHFTTPQKMKNKEPEGSGRGSKKHAESYPGGQKTSTPAEQRVCVAAGHRYAKSVESDWRFHDPFWVHKDNLEEFNGHYTICSKTGKWCHVEMMGNIFNGGRTSLKWLNEKGFIKLEAKFFGWWGHPDECFEYYSGHDLWKRRYLGPRHEEKNFQKCPITKRKYNIGEFCNVTTIDGILSISQEGIQGEESMHACAYCSEMFKEPLIGPFQEKPTSPPKATCVNCRNKLLEKSVVRHYDDSEFLPVMPDVHKVQLRGKEVILIEPRLFGLEIEVGFNESVRAEVAMDVWSTLGKDFCYIKHDGSITKLKFDDGYVIKNPMKMGFEIVTAPAGINVHRERWKALAASKHFKILRAWDADSCGLHVHVNRTSLTWLQIGRILVFMNHPNNRYFVEVVAGRSSNYYTRYLAKSLTDCGVVDESKYMAVRTNKKHTIEFRVFRSTVNYRHIIRDIEFTEAICDFCAPCANSLQDMTDFRCFIRFVSERPATYPMLSQWLQGIDLIAKKPLPNPKHYSADKLDEALSDAVKEQLAAVLKASALPKIGLGEALALATKNPKKDKIDHGQEEAQDPIF